MRWSWKIARIAGIDVELHATFLLLLAWVAFTEYQSARTVSAALVGILYTLALFASVVLHEYGHALTAARFGVRTRAITLLPIGGVARLERIPERPSEEFAIAVAGPAVTVAIVVVLFLVLRLTGTPLASPRAEISGVGAFFAQLMWVNVVLAVFNLIPAFPMDGGRVLRAALAMRMSHARATELAARIGKAFALLFALLGLFVVGNPFLVLIALFVWFSAAAEASSAQIKAVLGEVPVRRAMISNVQTLSPDESVANALGRVRSGSGFQHDFPVVEDHAVAGVLTREAMLAAIADGGAERPVREVMQRSFVSASPNEPLDEALARLQSCDCRTIPVLEHGQLVGLLTPEKIAEAAMTESGSSGPRDRSAMEQDPPSRSLTR